MPTKRVRILSTQPSLIQKCTLGRGDKKIYYEYMGATEFESGYQAKSLRRMFEGKIEKTGKTKLQFFTNSKLVLEGCDIGKRSSDKWVTCYHKSDELENEWNKSLKLWLDYLSDKTDEEIAKAAMHRLNAKFAAIVYLDSEGNCYFIERHKNKEGRIFWLMLIRAWGKYFGKLKKLDHKK